MSQRRTHLWRNDATTYCGRSIYGTFGTFYPKGEPPYFNHKPTCKLCNRTYKREAKL